MERTPIFGNLAITLSFLDQMTSSFNTEQLINQCTGTLRTVNTLPAVNSRGALTENNHYYAFPVSQAEKYRAGRVLSANFWLLYLITLQVINGFQWLIPFWREKIFLNTFWKELRFDSESYLFQIPLCNHLF